MFASTHPWRSAAVSLCGAAGLALAVGLGAAMETDAPAFELASDAVVMPSATPLPPSPATTDTTAPIGSTATPETPAEKPSSAEEKAEVRVADEPAPSKTSAAPMVGPAQPKDETTNSGGVLLVPQDIQPGTYQGTVPEGETCVWQRLKGTSGESEDVISFDLLRAGQRVTVTIEEGDAAFAYSGCGALTK